MLNSLLNMPGVELLGRVLLHSLWQGVAIAACLALALYLLRRISPELRYHLCLFALLACLATPIFTYGRLSTPSNSSLKVADTSILATRPLANPIPSKGALSLEGTGWSAAPIEQEAIRSAPRHTFRPLGRSFRLEPILPWLVVIWFLGVTALSLRLAFGLRLLRRLRNSYTERVPDTVSAAMRRLSQTLEIKGSVTVKLSKLVDVPLVVGYLKPLILIPTSSLSGLTPAQLELILAHELAHIRRGDAFVNLLQHVIETLLFFNPAVWWISNQICQEREYSCDQAAIAACNSTAHDYAKTLSQLNQTRTHTPSLAANGGSLLKRILKLLNKPLSPNPAHYLAGFSLVVMSFVVASLALAQSEGGVIRIAFESMPQLDPYKSGGSGEIDAFAQLFDPLILPDKEDFTPVPHLAESWENVDETTWVFTLREGVMFHDGNDVFEEGAMREMTADDVVYSINRFLEESTVFTLGDIESVTALDTYTVELKTPEPDPFLLSDPNRLARVMIIPQEAVEELGDDGFALNPIGTGPFKLESFTPDQELVLVRNDDYFVTPNLDGVEFAFIPDPTVQTVALEADDIDVVPYLFNIDSAEQLSNNPELTLLPGPGSYRGLGINVTTPPFDELAVRDAISKAMNIDAAVEAVIAPYGQRAYGQVPYWSEFEEDPELPGLWSYDPEGAIAQLEEAGFSDTDGDGVLDRDGEPLSFDIKTIAGSQTRVLTILATQLQELGIDANLLQQDGAVWGEDLQKGNDTGLFFDYSFASISGLYALFHGDNIEITNTHFYDNDEVDALLDEASATLDFDTRNDLWLEAQRIIMAERAAIPLYFENGYTIVNATVQDLVPGATGMQLVSLQNNVSLDR